MILYEFNNLDFEEKYDFVWQSQDCSFNCYRVDGEMNYVLFDCGTFYAESCVQAGKTIKIEGFDFNDDRVSIYIEWVSKHKDDPEYQLF
jgi:hypothetical protein